MGRESGGSTAGTSLCTHGATHRTSRGLKDEGVGERVAMVAGVGRYGGRHCEKLFTVPASKAVVSESATAALELAYSPLVSATN